MLDQPKTFPKTHRLSGRDSFTAVYDARTREARGPITVYAKPNGLKHARLGLSVSRRVGTAPRRNRIKRLLRESFRFIQHEIPGGYDLIVVVRPHEPMKLAEYRTLLSGLLMKLDAVWKKREV